MEWLLQEGFTLYIFTEKKNMANRQTIASAKWNKKAGYISKSYKLHKSIVEEFADACKKAGVSQASQLTKMMREFVKEQEGK